MNTTQTSIADVDMLATSLTRLSVGDLECKIRDTPGPQSPQCTPTDHAVKADQIRGETEGVHLNSIRSPSIRSRTSSISSEASFSEGRCLISSLPFELLHLILEYATPPNLFLDASICRGPSSAWSQTLRQLKSFVLVCRTWWDVGINLLYCHVIIRRIGQLPALLRSLEANPKLGSIVRTLQIDCFVPHGYHLIFEYALAQIWASFIHNTRLILNHQTDDRDHELPKVPDAVLSSTIDLEIGPGHRLPLLFSSLVQCTSLVCLTINFQGSVGSDDIPIIQFNFLEELHCTWNDRPTDLPTANVLSTMSKQWNMPRLKRFTVLQLIPVLSVGSVIDGTDYYPFLRAHGKKLIYLSICFLPILYSKKSFFPASMDIQSFLDLCPNLKHFATGQYKETRDLSHSTLEYLDVWADSSSCLTYPQRILLRTSLEEGHFPSLRKVRLLDLALLSTTGLRLPIIIPPDSLSPRSKMTWKYPGVAVCHGPDYLVQGDLDYLGTYCDTIEPEKPHPSPEEDGSAEVLRELPFQEDTFSDDDDWEWIPPSETPSDFSDDFDEDEDEEPSSEWPSSPSLSTQLLVALEIFEDTLARQEARPEEEEAAVGACSYIGCG
ncbi:hypothetical protein HYDPIDRAFT_28873 [Hydnomerulius pinastri MD-312]|uniref:F-box domain-containing protein n=1 Tax=Hydnomerulius pinastri MD-312 TaxID=994086 RepID=A0A0C9VZU0_9AGAM|nr:hypothetical protein HYDPIDRAFT_28873 [Hydnomerulius pinastri MD-312]